MSNTLQKHKPAKSVITLTFGKSTSKNYPIAVERAKQYDSYKESGEGKNILHSVNFSFDNIDKLMSLLELVGQWKTTALYINDKLTPFHEISRVIYCYSERQKSFNKEEYCFGRDDASSYNDNDLGCRHCGINPYGWHGLEGFGGMEIDGSFSVDKDKLIHTVATNLESFLICPALDVEKIKSRLKAFPASIHPGRNPQWEYVTSYDNEKEIATSVRKKDPKLSTGYVLEDYSGDVKEINIPRKALKGTKNTTPKATGCLLPILLLATILAMMIL